MDCDWPLVKILKETQCLKVEIDSVIYCSAKSSPIKTLANQGYFNEQTAVRKVSEKLGIQFLDLYNPEVLRRCKFDIFLENTYQHSCLVHKAIPLFIENDKIVVAFANPLDIEAQKELQFALGSWLKVVIAEEDKILSLLNKHFPATSGLQNQDSSGDKTEEVEILSNLNLEECDLDNEDENAAPIISFINNILAQAIKFRASDIHFDPTPNGLDVRYRVDGVMQHILDAAKKLQKPAISRLKLLSGMNIAERRAPQDGRFRIKLAGKLIDLRVSCVPTAYGEKVVLRILHSDFENLSFEKFGVPENIRHQIENDLSQPGRMLLVTGPTGSGKTTTLYTALKFLTDGSSNIETVEDPIEYKIAGVNQIQINESANVTFASCLRSILRQDPDVIMVGEIRDAETANIALQAAQTGHLVLSTLHTNDAPSAVTRLLNLGCDPFIVSNSLAGVLAQRLVRRICSNCVQTAEADTYEENIEIIQAYNINPNQLRSGTGCEKCLYTGYHGRIGIYSYLRMNKELSELIHKNASIKQIIAQAKKSGFVELYESALTHLINGNTSLSEVLPFLIGEYAEREPKTEDCAGQIHVKSKDNSESVHRSETIMLVEDDLDSRTTIAQHLRKSGFRVIELENAVEALKKVLDIRPDLILTGLGLPIMDGSQFLMRIRGQTTLQNVPVVVLTSADSDENEVELLKQGADEFISRSRSPAVVIGRIKKVLSEKREVHK